MDREPPRVAAAKRANKNRIIVILLLLLGYLPWFGVILYLASLPIAGGCNAYDTRKAFALHPDFTVGQLEVFCPVGFTRQERQLIFESLSASRGGGAAYDGHWTTFYATQFLALRRQQRVQLFVCDTERVNGLTRAGVLGYTEFPHGEPPATPGKARIYLVRGTYYELPDCYVQLHHAFKLNTDQWYQDQLYWAIVRGQGEGICEAIKLARGWVP